MKAYKGFKKLEDGTLWCRGFQYEIGKIYKFEGKPILCKQGFHACHEPWQCWQFYPNNGENVYYKVECGGMIAKDRSNCGKFVCTEITLIKEIPAPENKFDWCGYFHEGYAKVKLYDKCNHINTDGKLLSERWWDRCSDFQYGYAVAKVDDNWYEIDKNGKIIEQ